uniref:Uncharacterized protein n=1 Tax=viral metagenome TaxID=1070528 RepID=A0A6C0J8D7_9ZZZZ
MLQTINSRNGVDIIPPEQSNNVATIPIIENDILSYASGFKKKKQTIFINKDMAILWLNIIYNKKDNFEVDPKLNRLNTKYRQALGITGKEAQADLTLITSVLLTKNVDAAHIDKINHMSRFIGNDKRYTTKVRNDIFNFMEMFLRYITLIGKMESKTERNNMLEKFPPSDTNYGCIQALTALLKKELMLIECVGTEAFLLKTHEFCLQEMVNYIGDVDVAQTTVEKIIDGENAHIPSALNIILGINMASIDPIGSIVERKLETFWKDTWVQSYERRLNGRLQKVLQEDLNELKEIFADDLNDNYSNIREMLLIKGIYVENCIELSDDDITVIWDREKIKNILIQRYSFVVREETPQTNKKIDSSNFRLFYRGDARSYKVIFREGFQIGKTFEGVNTSADIKLARRFLHGGYIFGFVSDLNTDKNFSGDGEMYSEHYIFKSVPSTQIAFTIINNCVVFNPSFNALSISDLTNLIQKDPEMGDTDHMSQLLFEEING